MESVGDIPSIGEDPSGSLLWSAIWNNNRGRNDWCKEQNCFLRKIHRSRGGGHGKGYPSSDIHGMKTGEVRHFETLLFPPPPGALAPPPLLSKRAILSGQRPWQPQSTGQKLVSCKGVGGVRRFCSRGLARDKNNTFHWIETLEKDIRSTHGPLKWRR